MLLADLYDEFVIAARAANRSARTIDSYRFQVQRFQRFLDTRGYDSDCSAITARVIREYVSKLQTTHAAQTIANNVKSLKALFAFGVREELIASDPTLRVAVPDVPRRDYKVFDPSDVDTLLQACNVKTLTGVRDFAIIMLLFDSGVRASELVTITDADIDWQRGLILVYGKGAKERQVPVSPRTFRAIRRYQTKRKDAGYTHAASLFVNHKGDTLTRYGLNQLLERLGNRTGLHVHPHKFRHSFAVNALRNEAREYDIQDVLGHTTLQMTKRYARQSGEDLAKRHGRFSPASKLTTRI